MHRRCPRSGPAHEEAEEGREEGREDGGRDHHPPARRWNFGRGVLKLSVNVI